MSDGGHRPYVDRPRAVDAAIRAAQGPLARPWRKPLVRAVGVDLGALFIHGTVRRRLRTLHQPRPIGCFAGSDCNEFRPDLYLCDGATPHQALSMADEDWERSTKDAARGVRRLGVVEISAGSLVLDLSDEVARRPPRNKADSILPGEPATLRFFVRPAITPSLVRWLAAHPTLSRWATRADPALASFDVRSWERGLVPFARAQGWHAVRLADETLLVDRKAIARCRLARPDECRALRAVHDANRRGHLIAMWYVARPSGIRAALKRSPEACRWEWLLPPDFRWRPQVQRLPREARLAMQQTLQRMKAKSGGSMPSEKASRKRMRADGQRSAAEAKSAEEGVAMLLRAVRLLGSVPLDAAQMAVVASLSWAAGEIVERSMPSIPGATPADALSRRAGAATALSRSVATLFATAQARHRGALRSITFDAGHSMLDAGPALLALLLDDAAYQPPLSLAQAVRHQALASPTAKILTLLASEPEWTASQIADRLGYKPGAKGGAGRRVATSQLSRMGSQGLVTWATAQGERTILWSISPKGRAWLASKGAGV